MLNIRDEADKARYGRELPLSPRARMVLDKVCPAKGAIFQPVPHWRFARLLRQAARAAGIEAARADRVCVYDLRHARITAWVEAGGPLNGVAYLAGHKLLSTTDIYVRRNQRAAKAVLDREGGK